ncbi:hypothetical protein ABH942_000041 [Flavobacterium sp. 28YEA47A]|uniref:hypothetical protein n=1 Tax=Flavobacterium sp. 28YEA47A TaxID=3156276 RepID=UPI00351925F8
MTKIKFKSPILLTHPDSKQNLTLVSPLLHAKFQKGDTEGKEKWTLEIICTLQVSREYIEKSIDISMDDGLQMMGILPIKKIFLNKIDNFDYRVDHLWYIETETFELDEFYNIIELSVDDDPDCSGKRRGGKTVGIYTSLSKP